MPYIKKTDRNKFDKALVELTKEVKTPGELNYVITKLILQYFVDHKDYQHINDIIGALEGAKLEFYRRTAAPYEDKKIKDNGDVQGDCIACQMGDHDLCKGNGCTCSN